MQEATIYLALINLSSRPDDPFFSNSRVFCHKINKTYITAYIKHIILSTFQPLPPNCVRTFSHDLPPYTSVGTGLLPFPFRTCILHG
jgi:hypothetical protein